MRRASPYPCADQPALTPEPLLQFLCPFQPQQPRTGSGAPSGRDLHQLQDGPLCQHRSLLDSRTHGLRRRFHVADSAVTSSDRINLPCHHDWIETFLVSHREVRILKSHREVRILKSHREVRSADHHWDERIVKLYRDDVRSAVQQHSDTPARPAGTTAPPLLVCRAGDLRAKSLQLLQD